MELPPPWVLRARVGPHGRAMKPGAEMVNGMTARFGADAVRFEQDEGTLEVRAGGDASILLAQGPEPRRIWAIVNLVLAGLGWSMAELPGAALHAAGIVLEGRAFVLIGPEGAGKTTFCRVAADAGATVLSDDVTLVDASGPGVEALGAPFRHRPFPPPPRGRWPVAAILLPRQGPGPASEPVSRLALEARLAANPLYLGAGAGADPRAGRVAGARVERRVPCDACARGYCQPGWCENGIEVLHEPNAPEVNYANPNAQALLVAVGLDAGEYLHGAIDAAEVAGVLAKCEEALASDATGLCLRAGMLREREVSPRVVVAGSDDARARERLEELAHVLRWALENGAGIAWG